MKKSILKAYFAKLGRKGGAAVTGTAKQEAGRKGGLAKAANRAKKQALK